MTTVFNKKNWRNLSASSNPSGRLVPRSNNSFHFCSTLLIGCLSYETDCCSVFWDSLVNSLIKKLVQIRSTLGGNKQEFGDGGRTDLDMKPIE